MVWYSHLFKSFPQFVMIHIVKGFSVVYETEIDVFLEFSCFLKLSHSLSRVWLFAILWTVAHQAPPSMGFSRQEYWSGLPFPSPIPKKGSTKEDAIYHTTASISHASKVMLKILHARIQIMWTKNFQISKLDLEKEEEPEIK